MRAPSVVLVLLAALPASRAFAEAPPGPGKPPMPATAPAVEAPADSAPAPTGDAPAPTGDTSVPTGDATSPAPAGEAAAPKPPPPLIPPALVPPSDTNDEPGRPTVELATRRHGYRWQIAGTDVAAIAMSIAVDRIANNGDRPGALATLTIASYFFTAPLLHGVHRQGRRALGSFALRAGLPLVLGLIGEKIDGTEECPFCEDTLRSDGKVIGITIGALAAMAIDTALLARPYEERVETRVGKERVEKERVEKARVETRPRAVWAPALTAVRGGAAAGVFGTF